MTRRSVLPSSVNTPWAGNHQRLYTGSHLMRYLQLSWSSNRNNDFGAQYHSGFDSQSIPFVLAILSVYASTCHFRDVANITASRSLINTLQHSIRSLWLTVTPAGVSPACLQNISSTHVHGFVRRRFCVSITDTVRNAVGNQRNPEFQIHASHDRESLGCV